MNNIVADILLAAVPAILAITLHEAAHGYAALALGDDTAKRMGRLSLNPVRHIDPVGTILLPGFLLVSQLVAFGRVLFMFGWAKPVPVSAWRFRDPRRGMMLVAAAGPAMNFLLAWIGALCLHALPWVPPSGVGAAAEFVQDFILYNLVLGLFNLIPIPPLDGGRIAVGLLPLPLAQRWARLERAGIVLVILLVFLLPRLLADFGIAFNPVNSVLLAALERAYTLVLHLAGIDAGA